MHELSTFLHVNQSEQIHNSKFESKTNYNQILGCLLGVIHCIDVGYSIGYASVFEAQSTSFHISKEDMSWIASIFALQFAPSSILGGFLLLKMPKKCVLIIATAIEILAWLLIYISSSVTLTLIGRALSGCSLSIRATINSIFTAEISCPSIRGLSLSVPQVGIASGLLSIHIFGALFTFHTCALIAIGFPTLILCLILYLHETYAWHLRKGEVEKAKKAFYWYRGHSAGAKLELDQLLIAQDQNISDNYTKPKIFKLYCSKLMLKPFGIIIVAMVTSQLSGSSAIAFYSIGLTRHVIPALDQYTSTIIIDIIRILMTLMGCGLVIKFRVRPLFIISGLGCALSHCCFSYFISCRGSNNDIFSILSLLALICFTALYAIGLGPVVWVLAGEIFPLIIKGLASGLFTCCYCLTYFIIIKFTPDLFDFLGFSGTFIFFATCSMLGTGIIYFILPETKNKTLKEIEDMFR